jgi:transmembrane sensor
VKKYSTYSVEQFVSDEFFQQWVKTEDSAIQKFWEEWVYQNPQKSDEVVEAREIVLSFHLSQCEEYDLATENQLEKLMQKIEVLEQQIRKNQFYKSSVFKYAAAFLLIAVLLFGFIIFLISKAS